MIAKIIPIKRVPRQLGFLDYLVPEELEEKIKPGQLIRIPIRKSIEFGLVFSLPKSSEYEGSASLKPIESIEHETPLVSEKQLKLFELMSGLYGISAGTMAKMGLLPMQKRKLKKIELATSNEQRATSNELKPSYSQYSNESEHQKLVQEIIKKQTLVLVPERYHLDSVYALLSAEQKERTLIWHSGLSTKEKFATWMEVRNSEKNIVLGTRGAVFLPFSNLETIVIDYEHKENHKHWDQTPRFHAKDVAGLLSDIHGAQVHLLSSVPSIQTYFHAHKGNFSKPPNFQFPISNFSLINMADERRGRNYDIFSDAVKQNIIEAKEDIFLYINRLGFATSVGCNACGYVAGCNYCSLPLIYHDKKNKLVCHYCRTSEDMIRTCPKCKASIVQLRGVGTEQVEVAVRKLMEGVDTHNIIRIDSGSAFVLKESKKPRIIIGTQMALNHVRWNNTEHVILLDIDKELSIPEFRAAERVWYLINDIQILKREDCTLSIQSAHTQHLVLRSLKQPDRFYRTDLNARKSLSYPPYVYLVRYFYGHPNKSVAEAQAKKLHMLFEESLTDLQNSATLSDPIAMHPTYYRGKFWYTILVKLSLESWKEDIEKLNTLLPNTWRVDPNPISILSP